MLNNNIRTVPFAMFLAQIQGVLTLPLTRKGRVQYLKLI
jgi:hypothetical protein